MEFKVVIYIIGAIVYFLYTVYKKGKEKQEAATDSTIGVPKPVSPPVGNKFEEILAEIKRKKAETESQKRMQVARPVAKKVTPISKPKNILIHEKKKGVFEEGNYERDLTDEEKILRGNLKLENEGIYKIKSIEEMEESDTPSGFNFDLRNAILNTVILERKY